MRLVKVGVVSLKATVGAVATNVSAAIAAAHELAAANVTLGVFQEQMVGGYPPEDLVQWRQFVAAQRVELARFCRETAELDTAFSSSG